MNKLFSIVEYLLFNLSSWNSDHATLINNSIRIISLLLGFEPTTLFSKLEKMPSFIAIIIRLIGLGFGSAEALIIELLSINYIQFSQYLKKNNFMEKIMFQLPKNDVLYGKFIMSLIGFHSINLNSTDANDNVVVNFFDSAVKVRDLIYLIKRGSKMCLMILTFLVKEFTNDLERLEVDLKFGLCQITVFSFNLGPCC